jgi:gamma-glutamyltranspeptidase/glutathione hydrolase
MRQSFRVAKRVRAGVAAGHPATAAVGAELLAAGGTAGDAAAAMALASCVAETVLSGLLSGAHAAVFDGEHAYHLDGFASVPSGSGQLQEVPVLFGEHVVPYFVGPSSCAVPGLPATIDELWRRLGRLPWRDVVAPARRLAAEGVELPAAQARSLEMLAGIMTPGRGADIYTPGGKLLVGGDRLEQPRLVQALDVIAEEGARSVYEGTLAQALLDVEGIAITADDLAGYRAIWRDPALASWYDVRVATRGGLSGVPELLGVLPRLYGRSETERVVTLVAALETGMAGIGDTTNLVAVDADGRACVITHSLGVGAATWLDDYDLHLNNLLGERDIDVGPLEPGDRMESRMAPSLVFDDAGLALAIGAAGATRLRNALCTVLAGILDEGLEPQAAVDRPRFHPTLDGVDAEPGVDEQALRLLEADGRAVRRWPDFHHYFGGVSCVGRTGAAGDPRRGGDAIVLSY